MKRMFKINKDQLQEAINSHRALYYRALSLAEEMAEQGSTIALTYLADARKFWRQGMELSNIFRGRATWNRPSGTVMEYPGEYYEVVERCRGKKGFPK